MFGNLHKYKIYLIGAVLFSGGILIGYFLNPGKYEGRTAQEWYMRFREVALSRGQIVDCVNNSFYKPDPEQSLNEVKRCTFLIDLVPVDLNNFHK